VFDGVGVIVAEAIGHRQAIVEKRQATIELVVREATAGSWPR
jgi:hypothetical protein